MKWRYGIESMREQAPRVTSHVRWVAWDKRGLSVAQLSWNQSGPGWKAKSSHLLRFPRLSGQFWCPGDKHSSCGRKWNWCPRMPWKRNWAIVHSRMEKYLRKRWTIAELQRSHNTALKHGWTGHVNCKWEEQRRNARNNLPSNPSLRGGWVVVGGRRWDSRSTTTTTTSLQGGSWHVLPSNPPQSSCKCKCIYFFIEPTRSRDAGLPFCC